MKFLAVILALFVSASATAQTSDERIAELEHQVRILMTERDRSTNEDHTSHGDVLSDLQPMIFADVGYSRSTRQGNQNGFSVGSVNIMLSPRLGERFKSLVELTYEYDGEELHADLERLQIGYETSFGGTLWVGRFHTPYGYLNNATHHGPHLQTAVTRPRFLRFEDDGGILPAHTVGVWYAGTSDRFKYDLYAGNGPKLKKEDTLGVLAPNVRGDDNGNTMVGANVGYRLTNELTFGAHGYRTTISDWLGGQTDQTMTGVWKLYETGRTEWMSELYNVRNDGSKNVMGFSQFGYRFGRYVPYARYDRALVRQNDPLYRNHENGESYHAESVGLRYEIDPKVAIKTEFSRVTQTQRFNEFNVQFAVRF